MKARPRTHLVFMHPLDPGDGTEDRRDVARETRCEVLYRLVPLPVGVHCRDVGERAGKKPVVGWNIHLAHDHVDERVVHRAIAADGRHEIGWTDGHPGAGDLLLDAVDRQLRLHGAVGHVVEPAVIVGKMAYRLASQAWIEVALPHPSDDDQVSVCIRPKFAERADLQLRFAARPILLQIAIDCEMRHRYGIAAVDALRPGIKLEPFFSLAACFQLFVADRRFSGRSITREQRTVLGAGLTVEGAEIRLAVGKMRRPNDLYGSRAVAGLDLTDGAEFPVTSFFVFKDAKPRRLGFDLPVGCLERSLRAGLRIDVRRKFRNFRADEVEVITGVAARRIADPRDADRRMNSVLAFRHDVLSIAGQCQGSSRMAARPKSPPP